MRRISRFALLYCFASLLAVSVIPLQLHGQAVYGSISGTVTDNNGAVVPNAAVTVTNVRKGTSDKTTTNDSGNYTVTHLIPDIYNVRVEAPNFNAADIKGLQVSVDTIVRADTQLAVGNVSTSVEVTAEAPQLQTA